MISRLTCFLAGAYVGVLLHRFRVIYVPHDWDRRLRFAIRRLGRREDAA